MEFLHLYYIRGDLWCFQHLKLFCRRLIDETHSTFPKGISCRRNYNTNSSPYPKGISYKTEKKNSKITCVLEKTIIFASYFLQKKTQSINSIIN